MGKNWGYTFLRSEVLTKFEILDEQMGIKYIGMLTVNKALKNDDLCQAHKKYSGNRIE